MRLIEFIEMVASLVVVLAIVCALLFVGNFLGEQLELLWLMKN